MTRTKVRAKLWLEVSAGARYAWPACCLGMCQQRWTWRRYLCFYVCTFICPWMFLYMIFFSCWKAYNKAAILIPVAPTLNTCFRTAPRITDPPERKPELDLVPEPGKLCLHVNLITESTWRLDWQPWWISHSAIGYHRYFLHGLFAYAVCASKRLFS